MNYKKVRKHRRLNSLKGNWGLNWYLKDRQENKKIKREKLWLKVC